MIFAALPVAARSRPRRLKSDDVAEEPGELGEHILVGSAQQRDSAWEAFERPTRLRYIETWLVYTGGLAKHLIDIDEDALRAARAELGTETNKETVNRALRQAGELDRTRVKRALDRLARAQLADREGAWR